jgi:hypothetical protein
MNPSVDDLCFIPEIVRYVENLLTDEHCYFPKDDPMIANSEEISPINSPLEHHTDEELTDDDDKSHKVESWVDVTVKSVRKQKSTSFSSTSASIGRSSSMDDSISDISSVATHCSLAPRSKPKIVRTKAHQFTCRLPVEIPMIGKICGVGGARIVEFNKRHHCTITVPTREENYEARGRGEKTVLVVITAKAVKNIQNVIQDLYKFMDKVTRGEILE